VARRRLGVALLVPPPGDAALDALRRAVGDGSLGRVPPHVTLVPPVNVREDALADALARVRETAAAAPPRLTLGLGPPASFLPANPVLHLPVTTPGVVEPLRDKAFRPPLWREPAWPFVPHVTLADELAPERIAVALDALSGYSIAVDVTAVHLLQEMEDRVWRPIVGVRCGPPAVVGRGGLAVSLTEEVMADPFVTALGLPEGDRWVVARRDGDLAGVAVMAKRWLQAVFVVPAFRGEGIGAHLLARAVAPHRRALVDWTDPAARAFLERHGFRPAGHLLARETGP
jgi:GNAT superfamily N-acetyltransferase/2'-5' RNA ligase